MRPSNRQEKQSFVSDAPYEYDHVPPFHGSAGIPINGINRRMAVEVNSAYKAHRYAHEEHDCCLP